MIHALKLACNRRLDICTEWYKQSDKNFINAAPLVKDILAFYNDVHSESISYETCRRRLHKLKEEGLAVSKPLLGACTRWMTKGFIKGI